MMHTKKASPTGLFKIGVRVDVASLPVAGTGRLSEVRKSRRSKWRAGVLIGVHVLIALHIAHFVAAGRTISPVEPSEAMYTLELGYVNFGFIFFAVALAGTLIFGRFFCGWGCHIVALQDFCGWLMKKFGVRPRPFRSRFLAFAPLAVAFYMFVWPTLLRLASGQQDRAFPGFSNHLLTTDFWATFPGPVFTILTFAICGFAAVYFLGAKGFCSYGCPYGAFFGALDYASPGRIVVNDDCEQCGHCTVTCTSNVRVHEEVRLHGMVVDPGCMKCMDCVSVCPKGALSFSFALPALFKKTPKAPRARRFDLRLSEEVAVAIIALVTTLVFRDLYNGPPLLLSVGLGGLTAFLVLKLWRLVNRPDVRIQNLQLKVSGRLQRSGRWFAILTMLWLVFASHSGFAQWHRAWGRHYLDQTEVSRLDGLSGAFRSRPLSVRHDRAAAAAFRHFSLADRWGLVGVVEVKLGLAWCRLLEGDFRGASQRAEEALALAPDLPDLRQNFVDIQLAERRDSPVAERSAEEHFEAAGALAASGNLDAAAREYEACLAIAPDSFQARFNLGGVLRRMGRNEDAIEQLEQARHLSSDDPDVSVELGLAYMAVGANDDAIEALERAIALDPNSPESRLHLPEVIAEIRRSTSRGQVPSTGGERVPPAGR